jgi:esterase/lipase
MTPRLSRAARSPSRRLAQALLLAGALSALAGCAGRARTTGDAAEQVGSGWRQPSALAPVGDYDDYVRQVGQELRAHRLAFDPAAGERELALVAPFRQPPDAGCDAQDPRGIAILVHGLSDTAFAMRDLARSFARQCFEARALLLPGHGTRAADLLAVDHEDWLAHVQAAVVAASRENDTVVVAGFSLGATLALAVAATAPERVDAVIGLSPAYHIQSAALARQARWIAVLRPWLDVDPREEFARYEAMPTRGIAATMAAIDTMHRRVRARGGVPMPWMVVQSADDEVVDTARNRAFFEAQAAHARSVLVNYFSDPAQAEADPSTRAQWLPAIDAASRVAGLSHLAVHIAPDNPHYGIAGAFRNCGSTPFRDAQEIRACQRALRVWYGVGGQRPPPGEAGARATFNPHFAAMEQRLGEFLAGLDADPQLALRGRVASP